MPQDPRIIGGFLIGILCGTMLLEWVVHYFEGRAEEATKRMLDKVYKELALLGCIRCVQERQADIPIVSR